MTTACQAFGWWAYVILSLVMPWAFPLCCVIDLWTYNRGQNCWDTWPNSTNLSTTDYLFNPPLPFQYCRVVKMKQDELAAPWNNIEQGGGDKNVSIRSLVINDLQRVWYSFVSASFVHDCSIHSLCELFCNACALGVILENKAWPLNQAHLPWVSTMLHGVRSGNIY